jgi:hypothetical protein
MSASPTPGVSAGDIPSWSLVSAGFQDDDLMIFVLESDQAIVSNYQGDLSGTSFECTVQEQLQERLYCFGSKPLALEPWLFSLNDATTSEEVFQIEVDEDIFSH